MLLTNWFVQNNVDKMEIQKVDISFICNENKHLNNYLLYELLPCSEELFSKNVSVTIIMFLCLVI